MTTKTTPREDSRVPRTGPRAGSGPERRRGALVAALILTALVVLSALVGPGALQDAATAGDAAGARLHVGPLYLLTAPVGTVMDTLSLLTIPQHLTVLATLLLLYGAWRVARARSRRRRGDGRRRWWVGVLRETGVALVALAGLVAFYGYGMIGWRPMAALAVDDPDVLVLDVHSHTSYSHDGRKSFDPEANRAWHADAGFHAAYVSDHRNDGGYREATLNNPDRVGDATVLLPALEIKYGGLYASALGDIGRYRSAADGNVLVADSLYAAVAAGAPRPTMIVTLPSGLRDVPRDTPDSIGYVGIEVNDAAPRGLLQARRDRASLLRLADSLDLALVAGSNNHGWGRTAAAWTLLRIPGWRALSPGALDGAIEERLHQQRGEASRVVERRMPVPTSTAALLLTGPAITWQLFGGLSLGERLSWLLWVWAIALVVSPALRRPRARAPDHA